MAQVRFSEARSQPARGAVLMALAVLMFASMDVLTKHMALLGWLVFGHIPDQLALAGMALIAVGGVSAAIWPLIAALIPAKSAVKTGIVADAA